MDNEEIQGVKFSEFPSQTPVNADEVVGLHSGDNARFSIANIVAAVRNGLANIFVPKTDVGVADGVASLDSNGKVPGTQLDLSGKQSTITASGILKGDGQGGVSAATAGTDYQAPLTAGTDYATPAQLADKAAKSDLTSIQATGTTNTTGAAIPAGAYFYLNGILYQAKTQIDVNATFTVNTNCFQVSRGGLNDISQNIIRGTATFRNSEQVRDVFFNVTFLSPPTVVATFVGAKNDVRAQVANSAIYVQETTTRSCKLNIDRTATSGNVVVNYIAVGDIGLVRNAT